MSKKAYVLIETEAGKAGIVAKALQGKPGITAADVVAGVRHTNTYMTISAEPGE